MIEWLKKYNLRFIQNTSRGDISCPEVFEFVDRQSGLILCAPHAVRSFVCKKEKPADLFTGAIAQYLGITRGVSTLIRTKFTPYKSMVSDYIEENHLQNHYFLDIHGFNQPIDYDICLGIGNFPATTYPYLEKIIKLAEKYELKAAVNYSGYTGVRGLTGRYQKTFGCPNVIQLEIQRKLRDFYAYSEIVKNVTIPFLSEIVTIYIV